MNLFEKLTYGSLDIQRLHYAYVILLSKLEEPTIVTVQIHYNI